MKLIDVTDKTEKIFFRCLQDETSVTPRVLKVRRQWYQRNKRDGLRAKLLVLESGRMGGMCQYIPVAHSPLVGEDLLVILCLWVHGYDRGVGNQQARGYGRSMLQSIEDDARASGAKGVAVWGVDWEINWMPVSFFEHMGYERVDKEGKVVALWKPFSPEAKAPKLLRLANSPQSRTDKIKVNVAVNGWCLGCQKLFLAREAVSGLEDIVEYVEMGELDRASILHLGEVGGIFLDDNAFKPYEPPGTSEDIRAEIIRLHKHKQKTTP